MDAEKPASKGFMAQVKALGRAGLQETQRNAHLASLKAQIEKLKLVDVHKAQYALGRKAYELRITPERFGGEYDAIAAIESSIAEKRAGVPADHSASNIQLVKGAAISAKMKAEAEGLQLKLKQMFVALGSGVEGLTEAAGLENEMAGVRAVQSQIQELEKEYASRSADHQAQAQIRNAAHSLATDAAQTFDTASKRVRSISWVKLCVVLLLLASGITIGVFCTRPKHDTVKQEETVITEAGLAPYIASDLNQNKEDVFHHFHPMGDAKNIVVNHVTIDWETEKPTANVNDIKAYTVVFTIYWKSPLINDGFTKVKMIYDNEVKRYTSAGILTTNGATNQDVTNGIIDFGVGFLQGYLQQQQQ